MQFYGIIFCYLIIGLWGAFGAISQHSVVRWGHQALEPAQRPTGDERRTPRGRRHRQSRPGHPPRRRVRGLRLSVQDGHDRHESPAPDADRRGARSHEAVQNRDRAQEPGKDAHEKQDGHL